MNLSTTDNPGDIIELLLSVKKKYKQLRALLTQMVITLSPSDREQHASHVIASVHGIEQLGELLVRELLALSH